MVTRQVLKTWYGYRVDVKVPHTEGDGIGSLVIERRLFFWPISKNPRVDAYLYANALYQNSRVFRNYEERRCRRHRD